MTNLHCLVWMGGTNSLSDGNYLDEGMVSGGTTVINVPTKNSGVRLTGLVDGGQIHASADEKTQGQKMYCHTSHTMC